MDDHRDQHDPYRDPYRRHRGRGNPWSGSSGGQWGAPWGGAGWGSFGGTQSGPPPWLADLLGLAQTPPQRPHRRPRVRRGDVRTAILDVLRRSGERGEPVNGYQVIRQIAELSNDEWRPSPGSVYPTISQLEDEGLVTTDDEHGRRSLRLTEEGLAWTERHRDELDAVWAPFRPSSASPFSAFTDDPRREDAHGSGAEGPGGSTQDERGADFKREITQVLGAAWQLVTQGSDSQRRAAVEVLAETRRSLYGILADGRDAGAADDDWDDEGRP